MGIVDTSRYEAGQSVTGVASIVTGVSSPPRQFDEGDLCNVMDDIGLYAQIGRDALAVLRQKNRTGSGNAGIGTARTRGEIIKKAFDTGYLEKYEVGGKTYVRPTTKAVSMYDKISPMPTASILTSPEMTARWEIGLSRIESGALTPEQFMSKILPLVTGMVLDIKSNQTVVRGTRGKIGDFAPHPKDGQLCERCGKGTLRTLKSTNTKSPACGKRFVKCGHCGGVSDFMF